MSKNSGQSSIQHGIGIINFLEGKSFFVTGATGFLAKVLIEKILRTVPEVGKIYMLIRAKNEEAAMERLKYEIINVELFKCLQQTHGESYQDFMLSKLVPVMGNVCKTNLGLEGDLANVIANEVDIIINSAANTKFHERYDIAIDINTRGPSHVMGFAKNCKKLKIFVQVSTAYVNGKRQGRIMEKPLCMGDTIARELNFNHISKTEPKLDVESEIELAHKTKQVFENNDEHASKKMKELGLQRARKYGWENTYVFTKAMGEMMIDNMRGEDISTLIIRPSIIESTYKEPLIGWIEGNRMVDPIIIYYGKGQLRGFWGDPNTIIDIVPADMVVNAMLAAIAKHGAGIQKPHIIKVYQIASSITNPLVFKYLVKLFHEHFDCWPCLDSTTGTPIRVPLMKLFPSMEDFLAHLWEDARQRLGSSNLKLHQFKKFVEQAKYLATVYEPYAFYSGRFDSSNTQNLMESMDEEEKKIFGYDVGSIDWKHYITNVHIPGLRKHVIKETGEKFIRGRI